MSLEDEAMVRTPGTFGSVEQLSGGRYRARYTGPDGRRYKGPTTFLTKGDARAWLSLQQAEMVRKAWTPPEAEPVVDHKLTFKTYAESWLDNRRVRGEPLRTRTRENYRWLLDTRLYPTFKALPIGSITADDVRAWHTKIGTSSPTARAHAYGLLSAIMNTAVADRKVQMSPCVIRGAGTARRAKKIRPASLAELDALTEAMPEQYRTLVLLAAWCALRFGELTELRRADIELIQHTTCNGDGDETVEREGIIRVERAVVRVSGGYEVGDPKTEAGIRDVAIPPHLVPVVESHLHKHAGPKREDLLFPAKHGGHLAPATLYRHYYKARAAAGRPDLTVHGCATQEPPWRHRAGPRWPN